MVGESEFRVDAEGAVDRGDEVGRADGFVFDVGGLRVGWAVDGGSFLGSLR